MAGRTEDPEHEADLDVGEENVGRTKRVFECVVDVVVKPSVVVVSVVEEAGRRRDHVRPVVQSERSGRQQNEKREMRQSVSDELGRRTSQCTRHLHAHHRHTRTNT